MKQIPIQNQSDDMELNENQDNQQNKDLNITLQKSSKNSKN